VLGNGLGAIYRYTSIVDTSVCHLDHTSLCSFIVDLTIKYFYYTRNWNHSILNILDPVVEMSGDHL